MAKGYDSRVLKSKKFRAFAGLDKPQLSEREQKAQEVVRDRLRRVAGFLTRLGTEPSKEPELTENIL